MKYITKIFAVVILLAMLAPEAEAQIFKKLKKKAQNALENKAEQKIDQEMQKAADKMVDNSWDAVFGGFEGGEEEGKSPFSIGSDVTTEDLYDFDVITTMKISTDRADGESEPPMFMDMHFKEDAQYTGTKFRGEQMKQAQGDLFIIYDLKNSAMIMLMNNDKDKFSFAYDWKQALAAGEQAEQEMAADNENNPERQDEPESWKDYEKIGTKTIAGYSADGYRTENEQQIVEVWITKEAGFGMANMFRANANAKQLKGKIPEEYPQGMMMEMTMEDLTNGDKVFMEVTDIRTNANVTYTMADYPNMSKTMGKK